MFIFLVIERYQRFVSCDDPLKGTAILNLRRQLYQLWPISSGNPQRLPNRTTLSIALPVLCVPYVFVSFTSKCRHSDENGPFTAFLADGRIDCGCYFDCKLASQSLY